MFEARSNRNFYSAPQSARIMRNPARKLACFDASNGSRFGLYGQITLQ
jgi:hypothetical protein